MVGDYTEDSLVEQPAIALFEELGWETANCFYESFKDSPSPLSSPKGRGGLELPEEPLTSPLRSLPRTGASRWSSLKDNSPLEPRDQNPQNFCVFCWIWSSVDLLRILSKITQYVE